MDEGTTNRAPLPFLRFHQATFRLGDELVFANTSWTFHSDEHWAVLGPNASGKSLLADAIRGRLPLVHGELDYGFRVPRGSAPEDLIGHVSLEDRKHKIHGTVAQSRWNSIEEYGSLRVDEYLCYDQVMEINPFEVGGGHERARAEFQRRLHKAMRLLDLARFAERTLLSLSNGEAQRVELARALSRPMRLLILDEPFTGLDQATREHFHRALEELMVTPLRVLFVTTRREDLPRLITHALYLEGCSVVAAGPLAEIRQKNRTERGCRLDQVRPRQVPKRQPTKPNIARGSRVRSTASIIIELRNVTVRYDEHTILKGINWTVRAGESWALLGPNGSGKTTLLSLLLGDNPQAYANEVKVFGRARGSGQSIWELKRLIGWVSPELHLHFDDSATCLEVVASGFAETVGLFEKPTRKQHSLACRQLERFNLLGHAETPLFALSAGLQRTALLARALVKQPRLLILDEPCQGLDPQHRRMFIDAVDPLIRRGSVAAIYVTHRPDEIPPSIERVLRLSHGRAHSERLRTRLSRDNSLGSVVLA